MAQRLKRKKRTNEDLGILDSGGLDTMADNAIKEAYRLNDAEYDFIAGFATDDQMDVLFGLPITSTAGHFGDRRKIVVALNDLLDAYDRCTEPAREITSFDDETTI